MYLTVRRMMGLLSTATAALTPLPLFAQPGTDGPL